MKPEDELQATIADMTKPGKGILAADESLPTISKRFKAVGIDCTDETRRAYRSLLITTPGAEQFLSGVILFEETLGQNAEDGTPLPQVLSRRGIMPGIKVDKGTTALPGAPGDLITQGLDGLAERLKAYKAQGMRFAKWREVYGITEQNPTSLGIDANAEVLARYAEPGGMLSRRSATVRAAAIEGLRDVAQPEARGLLELYSRDKEPLVRKAAEAALK